MKLIEARHRSEVIQQLLLIDSVASTPLEQAEKPLSELCSAVRGIA